MAAMRGWQYVVSRYSAVQPLKACSTELSCIEGQYRISPVWTYLRNACVHAFIH